MSGDWHWNYDNQDYDVDHILFHITNQKCTVGARAKAGLVLPCVFSVGSGLAGQCGETDGMMLYAGIVDLDCRHTVHTKEHTLQHIADAISHEVTLQTLCMDCPDFARVTEAAEILRSALCDKGFSATSWFTGDTGYRVVWLDPKCYLMYHHHQGLNVARAMAAHMFAYLGATIFDQISNLCVFTNVVSNGAHGAAENGLRHWPILLKADAGATLWCNTGQDAIIVQVLQLWSAVHANLPASWHDCSTFASGHAQHGSFLPLEAGVASATKVQICVKCREWLPIACFDAPLAPDGVFSPPVCDRHTHDKQGGCRFAPCGICHALPGPQAPWPEKSTCCSCEWDCECHACGEIRDTLARAAKAQGCHYNICGTCHGRARTGSCICEWLCRCDDCRDDWQEFCGRQGCRMGDCEVCGRGGGDGTCDCTWLCKCKECKEDRDPEDRDPEDIWQGMQTQENNEGCFFSLCSSCGAPPKTSYMVQEVCENGECMCYWSCRCRLCREKRRSRTKTKPQEYSRAQKHARVRSFVASGLNRVGCAKDSKTLKYLGTTSLDNVVAHIQAKMDRYNAQHTGETQMSFANVELDHIKPVQRFALELSHYTNIQPMLKEANRSKAAKWSDLDETFWRANIQHQPAFTDIYGGGGAPHALKGGARCTGGAPPTR